MQQYCKYNHYLFECNTVALNILKLRIRLEVQPYKPQYKSQLQHLKCAAFKPKLRISLENIKPAYLGRHTHKTAISNHRIQNIDAQNVTFEYKDYRHEAKKKIMVLM